LGEIEKRDLKKYLKGLLPEYMVPTKLHRVDNMPLNKNGKIDRKSLMQDYLDK